MRNQRYLIGVLFVAVAMSMGLGGCATGGAASDAERVQALERANEELRQSVEAVRMSLEQLEASLVTIERNAEELKRYMEMPERIRQGAGRISEKLRSIEAKLDSLERLDPAKVSVRVLSVEGRAEVAQEAARLLKARGYDVGEVGETRSEGSDVYDAYEVIFAEGFAAAARDIARALGHGDDRTISIRPLTWSSVYDVIVVTGGKD